MAAKHLIFFQNLGHVSSVKHLPFETQFVKVLEFRRPVFGVFRGESSPILV